MKPIPPVSLVPDLERAVWLCARFRTRVLMCGPDTWDVPDACVSCAERRVWTPASRVVGHFAVGGLAVLVSLITTVEVANSKARKSQGGSLNGKSSAPRPC